jgi:hypothetical protein
MLCYIPGTAFAAAAFSIFGYLCWGLVCRIFDIVWTIGVITGKAVAATLILVVATFAVAFIKWTADRIRRRQHGAGACNDCAFACKAVHTTTPAKPRERLWTKLSTYVGEPVWRTRQHILPVPARTRTVIPGPQISHRPARPTSKVPDPRLRVIEPARVIPPRIL